MKIITIFLLLLAVIFEGGMLYEQRMELESVNEQFDAVMLRDANLNTDRTIHLAEPCALPKKLPTGIAQEWTDPGKIKRRTVRPAIPTEN